VGLWSKLPAGGFRQFVASGATRFGPLTRNPGLRLAFIRGPEGIMIELVQR
jgi:hypothetical protein